jgi:hypothetical protein
MCSKTRRGVGRPGYHSIMCSTPEHRIAQIGQAIDDLAAQAHAAGTANAADAQADTAEAHAKTGGIDADEVLRRLAELWAQLAQLDPDVGKRLPTYEA